MYSVKEKLNHFRQLSSSSAAEADLALLREKSSTNTNLIRYGLAPNKNAEDILFDLLDVCSHEEIVRNRRDLLAAQQSEEETDHIPDGKESPKDENNEKIVAIGNSQKDGTSKEDDTPDHQVPAPKTEVMDRLNESTTNEQAERTAQAATEKKRRSPKKKSTPK